jgi:long-chain acyl-CoA synthetase
MPRTSILEYLENFSSHADEIAYVQREGYRTVRWTYGEVLRAAIAFAGEVKSRNIGKGDHVLLWANNSAEWVAVFFGCILRGAVVVPIDVIAQPDFARRVAAQVQANLIVCANEFASVIPALPVLDIETVKQWKTGDAPASLPAHDAQRSDVVEVVFTSGTTAEPRGVVLTHGNLLANLETLEPEIRRYIRYERPFHPVRFLNLVPLSHTFGQFMGFLIPQLIAGTVVFQKELSPAEVVRSIKRERISVLVAVPRLLESLKSHLEREYEARGVLQRFHRQLAEASKRHFLWRWWRFRRVHRRFGWKFWALISGGATLDRSTDEFWRRLGYAVIQGYGLTETTSLISVAHPFKLVSGSIGKVLPGRELKLDASGEILVRGEAIAAGYFAGKELSPVAGDEGWFHTGDLGELNPAGNLFFKGRKKQVIVTAEGLNVFPEDLEAALRQQPDIREATVFGLSRNGNAEPCAAVIVREGADAASAVQRANASLAGYQQVRRWFLWPEADFPRTHTGKVQKFLVQTAAERHFAGGAEDHSIIGAILARLHRGQAAAHEDELNLSSIERVELACALEERYQVDLDDSALAEARTTRDLEKVVERAAPSLTRYRYPRWAQRWPHRWLRALVYDLLTWPATFLLAKPCIHGQENLRAVQGPLLIVSNHVTYIDIGFILFALPRRLRHRLATAMGGEVLIAMRHPPASLPLWRRWYEQLRYRLVVALFNVFPLPQRSGYRESFEFCGELVDHGSSVLIFPEGRRTPDGNLHDFQAGVGLLATRLHVPVLPIRIDGLWEVAQRKALWARRGEITVRIGVLERFDEKLAPDDIARQLQARMAAL